MRNAPALVLYSRASCHLCEEAAATLAALRARHPHRLEIVDITRDPVLFERYRQSIPVLVVDGREYAAPLTKSVLERALLEAR